MAMYSMEKEEDISKLLQYHRAKDMVNIMKYFPGLSPVDKMVIIKDKEDFLKNQEQIRELTHIRNGNPIQEICMRSIPTKELEPDILAVLDKIKIENPNGVLILFHLNVTATERYGRYAGISIGVSLGNAIYIDAVGKGFDGREVLKGISCHERYCIPWNDIRKVNIEGFKQYRSYLINQVDYEISRAERIRFLESCGIKLEMMEEHIPKEYQEIPDFIWLDIIQNVIKVVEKEEDILQANHFLEFNLSGHTEGKRFRPWQMADATRM